MVDKHQPKSPFDASEWSAGNYAPAGAPSRYLPCKSVCSTPLIPSLFHTHLPQRDLVALQKQRLPVAAFAFQQRIVRIL